MVFGGGNLRDGSGELQGADGSFDLAAETAGQGEQLRSSQVGGLTPGQFRFDLAELLTEGIHAVGGGGEPLVAEGLQLDGFEVLNLELVFATPRNERGLGDVEFGHEARIRPAAGAQFNEALDGFIVVHLRSFPAGPLNAGPPEGGTPNVQTGTGL